ncbi:MAG: manganese efflux pump MntP family protein [Adlercreutzia equolifaciens]
MGFIELFLTGVGLSMDAFAVAICKGLGMRKIRWRDALVIALFFGGFQALMPLIGWAAGSLFASTITAVDHWIAFGLLAFIGAQDALGRLPREDSRACAGVIARRANAAEAPIATIPRRRGRRRSPGPSIIASLSCSPSPRASMPWLWASRLPLPE